MNINIVPIKKTLVCNRIQLEMDNFQLKATKGSCKVLFYNEMWEYVKMERVEIPEDVYANWGIDDQIIVHYVLNALQLQEASEL